MSTPRRNVDFLAPPAFDLIYEPAITALKSQGHDVQSFTDRAEYLKTGRLAQVDVLVNVDILQIGASEMDQAPRLRAIVTPVIGTEEIDENAARERLILIANGHTVENYTSMAEAALLLILASLYDFNNTQKYIDESIPRPDHPRARMLMGKTVGLVGFGQITQALAERLIPFRCTVQAAIRTPRPLPDGVATVPLDELLRTSDVIVLGTEISSQTRGMLSAERLATTKPDMVFVNVARGGIASDGDLAELAAARPDVRLALDVYDPEPLDPSSPLLKLPNAILTPHMVGHTTETFSKMSEVLLDNILRPLSGEAPRYVRNRTIIDAWSRKWSPGA